MIVVFVNPVGTLGGSEKMLLTMMSALQYEDPDIDIHLIVGNEGNLVDAAQKLGVKVSILPIPDQVYELGDRCTRENLSGLKLLFALFGAWGAIGKYLNQFRALVREIKPDILHCNGIHSHVLTAMANLNLPIIWHIQNFYSRSGFIASALRWYSPRVKIAIACSEAVGNDARRIFPKLTTKVIFNSVDTDYFYPRAYRPLALAGIDTSVKSIKVGLVANFARGKGHDIFLESAAIIARDRPSLDIHFYIIGTSVSGGYSLQELQNLAADLGITSKVSFIGFQPNMADIYLWLDIVVNASTKPEPFGYAIAEAMACGKPVIVARAGGAAELFMNDLEAVAFNPGDAATLAATIQYLICNPHQCKVLGENARKKILRLYSQNQLGGQIISLYKILTQTY
ncbi:glycosyltransferase [Synechococcus sp. PCC 7502]|uniref:glycosyltransferase family 4 protein n=1 Tax=Synechococcus sp. PCC 7502 TaxID=1173263 RepID=UPI00029FEEC7|nr:glycosyltransferase family 4 protein [Synechococcus sp. PCC 7502]AFY73352.1 glycosyltransferase [Synechococcus sp. PCC 7502]